MSMLWVILLVLIILFIIIRKRRNMQIKRTQEIEQILYQFGTTMKADGIDESSQGLSDILIKDLLTNESLAYEFVLQELDGARQGNSYAQQFAENSGISESEYYDAIYNDCPKSVNDAIRFLIANTLIIRTTDADFAVALRCAVVDKIMQYYEFGKYEEVW